MRFNQIIHYIALLCAGILIFLLVVFINLPDIVASQAKGYLSQLLKSDQIEFKIKRIGFSQFYISDIQLASGISIDSIDVNYTIKGFSTVKLKTIKLSGLTIQAHLDQNNQIKIQGFEIPKVSQGKGQSQSPNQKPDLTFLPEKIVLKHGKLVLKAFGDEILIPFEALSILDTAEGKIVVQSMIAPYGQKIRALLRYKLDKGIQFIGIEASSFDLALANRFISEKSSTIVFNGRSDIKLETISPLNEWKLDVSKLSLAKPTDIVIKQILATLKFDNKKIDVHANFDIKHENVTPIHMNYEAFIDLSQNNNFHARLEAVNTPIVDINHSLGRLVLKMPKFIARLNGTPQKSAGDLYFGFDSGVFVSNEKNKSSKYIVQASRVKFDIPFTFPEGNTKAFGNYSVPSVLFQNQYQGGTHGKIVHTGLKQFKINGKANFKPLPGFLAEYSSSIGFENGLSAVLDFNVKPFKITDRDIERLAGLTLDNAVIEAIVTAKGKAVVQNHQTDTSLEISIKNGQLQLPESNLTATGIHTTVMMADLLNLRSLPGQIMEVDSIDINKIKIKEAKVRFSIENKRSFLVENLQFKWCDGLVSSEAIRFPQKNNQYRLTLYCDRLEMSQLLQQLGAFQSEGNGTLNGRIPVIYSDGNISFNNGFLFSTPGSGGRVAIENTEKLTAGIPMDSPQFSQLDLAREALKDFNYKWAKLKLNTVGNTLAVAMELDGKPSKTLPFKYEKEFGGFIRVDASSPGSNFQGIKLDVNLKLPFNEVMKFGNKLKSLFN